ncbi:MAG: hypothetical protein Q7J44_03625 [Pseudotabrizicola sp.]|uniref:hypothetical protein n=1 Tax=Pseudotabrizicola sp. TaxID=2939647 RepID=UPI002718A068|nr:hypothetical protein [Pseudotabrizicola sp.]MDO9637612.1 hypothetical protein [Pseudotabrizicola sp.]
MALPKKSPQREKKLAPFTPSPTLMGGADIKPEQDEAVFDGLTEAEREKVKQTLAKARARTNGPPMGLKMEDGVLNVLHRASHNEAATGLLLMADLGTADPHFHAGVTGQVATLGSHGKKLDEVNSNFVLSVVRAVEPRDELEAMLAVQMGAIHAATMMMARKFNHVDTIPQQDAAERALNKLARTYAMQMEALKRYRTGGQQKVTVEHVTVNAGGQAIVGAVAHGVGGQHEK